MKPFRQTAVTKMQLSLIAWLLLEPSQLKKANFLKSWGLPEAWIPEETQLCKLV